MPGLRVIPSGIHGQARACHDPLHLSFLRRSLARGVQLVLGRLSHPESQPLLAAIMMAAPVWGLRPGRASRVWTSKGPQAVYADLLARFSGI
jgi:hypothetical protein